MKKFKKVILIVMDSVGVGHAIDAAAFNDEGANTFLYVSEFNHGLNIPNLNKLGLYDIDSNIIGTSKVNHPHSYVTRLNEKSLGKDTLTGHWEMMGIYTEKPFKTFTENGFPQELIKELEKESGHKFIGNKSASGTEIIEELGPRHLETGEIIIYTSQDSVLQMCANERIVSVHELYRVCEIARKLCMQDEYKVARVIARPFIGEKPGEFKRTYRRHDFCLEPSKYNYLDLLHDSNLETICVGKISDIFSGRGVSDAIKSRGNHDGMTITIDLLKRDFKGLIFTNLVEFDQEYGHRRDPKGYGRCIEEFDKDLGLLLKAMSDDDLLMITADHGNDPTFRGSDHTREQVPLIIYSPQYKDGSLIKESFNFGDIGRTIIENFDLKKPFGLLGNVLDLE